jgi:hypothetical protein
MGYWSNGVLEYWGFEPITPPLQYSSPGEAIERTLRQSQDNRHRSLFSSLYANVLHAFMRDVP